MPETVKPKRIARYDYLRIIAMFAVVAQHVFGGANMSEQYNSINLFQYFSVTNIVRFNVPIFIMISGCFLLRREKPFDTKKHICRMLIVLASTCLVYSLGNIFVTQHGFALKDIVTVVKELLSGSGGDHLWYLYMLIALYFITPVIKKWLSVADDKQVAYIIIILFVFSCLIPTLSSYSGLEFELKFPVELIYVFYYLLGYYLSTRKPKYNMFVYLATTVIFAAVAAVEGVFCKQLIPFHNIAVVGLTVSLFLLFQAVTGLKETKIIEIFSRCSFGVYLIHCIFIHIMYQVLNLDLKLILNNFIITGTVYTIGLTVFCTVIIYLMLKIPFVRKLI